MDESQSKVDSFLTLQVNRRWFFVTLCTVITRTSATAAGFARSSRHSWAAPDQGKRYGSSEKAAWTLYHKLKSNPGSLSSSQPGGPPCWVISLAFGVTVAHFPALPRFVFVKIIPILKPVCWFLLPWCALRSNACLIIKGGVFAFLNLALFWFIKEWCTVKKKKLSCISISTSLAFFAALLTKESKKAFPLKKLSEYTQKWFIFLQICEHFLLHD